MTIPRNETVCARSNCEEHRPDSLYARCALYCREMSTTDCIKTRCQKCNSTVPKRCAYAPEHAVCVHNEQKP